jgi:predicted TIM-barrel fold metal-dependent hydrolase
MMVATFRVCLGGVLEDFPDLKLIMNHFGGGISAIKERVDAFTHLAERPDWGSFYYGKKLISKPYEYYLTSCTSTWRVEREG